MREGEGGWRGGVKRGCIGVLGEDEFDFVL